MMHCFCWGFNGTVAWDVMQTAILKQEVLEDLEIKDLRERESDSGMGEFERQLGSRMIWKQS